MADIKKSLKERVRDYYGNMNSEIERFFDKKTGYTEKQEDEIFDYLVKTFGRDEGCPDIKSLSTAYSNFTSEVDIQSKLFTCNVCEICKAKYDYKMMYCPNCWKRDNKKVSLHTVLVKPEPITGVITYNKNHFSDQNFNNPEERKAGYKSCYFCSLEIKRKCDHFGNIRYICHDQDMCDCRSCCASVKKKNEELQFKIDSMKQKQVEEV